MSTERERQRDGKREKNADREKRFRKLNAGGEKSVNRWRERENKTR